VNKKWLIYGASGYTGKLIIEEVHKRGLEAIIAGRDEAKIKPLAEQMGFEYRCFSLDSRMAISEAIQDIDLVLHCAGPFSQTAKPMMAACLHAKTHYLDITGEIAVFEHGHLLHQSAQEAGVVICPGVGFDVVPTDCMARALSEKLPDADSLWLGFSSRSGLSPGTAKTSVEGIADGGKVRRDGLIVDVPLAYKVRKIDFGDGSVTATTIPWGDVSTAYYSTGIPNIDVYIPLPEKTITKLKRLEKIRWIFRWQWLINFMKKKIDAKVKGPSEDVLLNQKTLVWGEVLNPKGDVVSGRITTANGYQLTMLAAIEISQHLLNNACQPGFTTPSQLMGSDFIEKLPGSGRFEWQDTRSE
jgi:short subunit dehydrogenase-like uncharacterized protein